MAVSFQLLRSSTASKRPNASSLSAGELGLNFNDDTSGLFYENASGDVMKVGPTEVSATAPNASPASGGSTGNSLGELWYDTGNSILKVYDGSSFVASANVTTITGVTAGTVSASKAVVVDSDKDVTGFRNVTLTGDLTVPEGDLVLGSTAVTSTAAELNTLDGVTAGTVTASKAVVVDSDKDLSGIRTLTLEGWLIAPILDISGNVDIDGITNLDAVDIDGNVNLAGNLTLSGGSTNVVLTDNTAGALDIKEGVTSYLKFDTTDGSELITASKPTTFTGDVTIPEGDLILGSTAVTSTAAEINTLDGVTAGTVAASKAVVVDADKDVTGFRNVTLTGDLTVPEGDLILGSAAVTSTAAEINTLDGVTAGTVTASKALVVDSNKDLASLRNLTLTGDLTVPEGDLVLGSAAVTSTAAELNILDDCTATTAELNYNDTGAAVGTVVASKTVTADADKDVTGFRNVTLTGELDAATLDVSSTSAFADNLTVENQKEVRFSEATAGGSNYTGFRAPAALTANVTFTLPDGDGSDGQVLVTDGSGTLSWASNSSTTTGISTAATGTAITLDSSNNTTVEGTLTVDGTSTLTGDVTFPAAQDIGVIDNSGLALRIMESTNEYLRVITTDGSESVTIKKTLETDGDLQLDGGMTAAAETNINLADNTGFALRFMEGSNEYMRFRTTDGDEEVDFSVAVNLDGAVTLNNSLTVTGDRDITMDSGTSNAIDFVISGGNRMMRFNTNTETVLLEQNFEVDGTATFDGAMDIDNTMDISGGDVTFSANTDIHIPDNSGQALDIAEAGNTYVRFITTDDAEKIEVSKDTDFNGDVYVTGGDVYFDNASNSQLHLQNNQQYALEIRDPNTPYCTFDTRSGQATYGVTFSQPLTCSQTATFSNNITFDGVTLSAIQTSAETFADNDTSIMTSAAVKDLVDTVSGVSQTEGTFTATFRGSTGEPGTLQTTTGYYVQIGKMVTVTVDTGAVSWTGYTGNFSVEGLPATAKSGYDFVGSFVSSGGVFESANNDGLVCHVAGGGTVLDLRAQDGDNASVTWSQQGTDTINFTITYFTA